MAKLDERLNFEVAPSSVHGLGVFTRCYVPRAGMRLWMDPVIYVTDKTELERIGDYTFAYSKKWQGLVLGRTSIMNHDSDPNVEVTLDTSKKLGSVAKVYSTRPIAAGEELFIDYGSEYWTSR